MRDFLLIGGGQIVSLIGSALTGFAMGVWVYEQTGSVTRFSLIYISALLPAILISPLAGALTDRWNRGRVIILSDIGAALSTVVIAILLLNNRLEIWHICLLNALNSVFRAFQGPAFSAAITLLVPERHLGRANGMTQTGRAIARLLSPVLAGVLLGTIGLYGIIVIDFATFVMALIPLIFVRIPDVTPDPGRKTGKKSLFHEAMYGWRYITEQSGLFGLLIFFTIANFFAGLAGVLFTPLILSFTSASVLGIILSTGSIGMLAGGLTMSIWGGPKRHIYGIFSSALGIGLCILSAGLHTYAPLFAVAAFFYYFGIPIINSCNHVIFQKKIPPDVQGRAFAMIGAIVGSSLPLAYLVAGPLVDHVFEPLMAPDGLLAGSMGQLIGTGPGRGIGLMFIIMGGFIILATLAAYSFSSLRGIEGDSEK
ncbi:Major facilitator superfamily transporter [Desulfonema magnum]|uniref:Major facilitator superfamily transporter n=2 Tax=Desulfonema magnum TaxID=45655 RepID=A0A975BUL0_9BACT|nr:Major facilitator superfamily transporter [Desulfonema magnum]